MRHGRAVRRPRARHSGDRAGPRRPCLGGRYGRGRPRHRHRDPRARRRGRPRAGLPGGRRPPGGSALRALQEGGLHTSRAARGRARWNARGRGRGDGAPRPRVPRAGPHRRRRPPPGRRPARRGDADRAGPCVAGHRIERARAPGRRGRAAGRHPPARDGAAGARRGGRAARSLRGERRTRPRRRRRNRRGSHGPGGRGAEEAGASRRVRGTRDRPCPPRSMRGDRPPPAAPGPLARRGRQRAPVHAGAGRAARPARRPRGPGAAGRRPRRRSRPPRRRRHAASPTPRASGSSASDRAP